MKAKFVLLQVSDELNRFSPRRVPPLIPKREDAAKLGSPWSVRVPVVGDGDREFFIHNGLGDFQELLVEWLK